MRPSNSRDICGIADSQCADETGVQRFAEAMLKKLAKKRREGNRGWNYPVPKDRSREYFGVTVRGLETMLRQHLEKGDVVDLANFCMMIWNRRNPRGLK